MIFSNDKHIGTLIFSLGNSLQTSSLDLFCPFMIFSLIEILQNFDNDKTVLHYDIVCNKSYKFESQIKNKNTRNFLNNLMANFMIAKLSKFKNAEPKSIFNEQDNNNNKENKDLDQQFHSNIKFTSYGGLFTKYFTNCNKLAGKMKEGEILYKL